MTSADTQVVWSWKRIVGYSAALAVLWLAAQVGALFAVLIVQIILTPNFDAEKWAEQVGSDGLVVSAATFAAAALCIPAVRVLVSREPRPWDFLGFRRVPWQAVATACVAIAAFIAVADTINVWIFGRPLVPPFLQDSYATARKPILLFLAVAVLAPVSEEMMMRGFLFAALRARNVPVLWTVVITTVLFTLPHTQYDVHDTVSVFLMGLLFGWARARFDSIVPAIAMHSTANIVAFFETVWMMRS